MSIINCYYNTNLRVTIAIQVSQWYELVIFTASLPEYADPVIDWLDPEARYFKRRLFRNACTPHGFSFAKDLTLAQADLSRVILVDNSPASYALHKGSVPMETHRYFLTNSTNIIRDTCDT